MDGVYNAQAESDNGKSSRFLWFERVYIAKHHQHVYNQDAKKKQDEQKKGQK